MCSCSRPQPAGGCRTPVQVLRRGTRGTVGTKTAQRDRNVPLLQQKSTPHGAADVADEVRSSIPRQMGDTPHNANTHTHTRAHRREMCSQTHTPCQHSGTARYLGFRGILSHSIAPVAARSQLLCALLRSIAEPRSLEKHSSYIHAPHARTSCSV